MFEISINNIVTVSRGHSFSCPLFLNVGTDCYPIRYIINNDDPTKGIVKDGEYIVFAIERPNQPFECAIVRKTFIDKNENGDVIISIDSKDTINLCPGGYYYEIKAYLKDDEGNAIVNTVVEQTKFTIL